MALKTPLLSPATKRRVLSFSTTASRRHYHELSYKTTGDPLDVLQYHQTDHNNSMKRRPPKSIENPVHVKMMHAPWNPADMNAIQGSYASPYPTSQRHINRAASLYFGDEDNDTTVAGSEGWGQVVIGDDSGVFQPGDWVTMGLSGYGTYRSHLICDKDALIHVKRGQELMDAQGPRAAALFQLGGTAYRLLSDFVDLNKKSGPKIVVQNAGNSGVGFMASQLASLICNDTVMVSLVRRSDRSQEDMDELVEYLSIKGKNHLVVSEEDLADKAKVRVLRSQLEEISDVCLALNAVGGESSDLLLKLLEDGGTHVTYGGMSKKPVTVLTPQLIFKDLRVQGYWHSRWMVRNMHERHRKEKMINELVDLVLSHELVCPMVKVYGLSQFKEALKRDSDQTSSPLRRKVVFYCGEDDM